MQSNDISFFDVSFRLTGKTNTVCAGALLLCNAIRVDEQISERSSASSRCCAEETRRRRLTKAKLCETLYKQTSKQAQTIAIFESDAVIALHANIDLTERALNELNFHV